MKERKELNYRTKRMKFGVVVSKTRPTWKLSNQWVFLPWSIWTLDSACVPFIKDFTRFKLRTQDPLITFFFEQGAVGGAVWKHRNIHKCIGCFGFSWNIPRLWLGELLKKNTLRRTLCDPFATGLGRDRTERGWVGDGRDMSHESALNMEEHHQKWTAGTYK